MNVIQEIPLVRLMVTRRFVLRAILVHLISDYLFVQNIIGYERIVIGLHEPLTFQNKRFGILNT